jgi:hypothetical protein
LFEKTQNIDIFMAWEQCRGATFTTKQNRGQIDFCSLFFAYYFLKVIEKINWVFKIRVAIFAQIKTQKK